MAARLVSKDNGEAVFLIEIDGKEFEQALLEAYREATAENKPDLPPLISTRAMLAQYPELEKLSNAALDKLLPLAYQQALDELGLTPMTFPRIAPRRTVLGQPCLIEARVILEPEIKLAQYEGLAAAYTPVVVTEQGLKKQMDGIRKQHDAMDDDQKLLEALKQFKTIEEAEADMASSMRELAEEKNLAARREAVLDALLAANPISLPEEVVEQQVMMEIGRFRQQIGPANFDNYMKSSGRTIDDIKREVRPQAEQMPKRNLLLAAVATAAALEPDEEQIQKAVMSQMQATFDLGQDYEVLRQRAEATPGAMDKIRHGALLEKALDYIVEHAVLTENAAADFFAELPEYLK